MINQAGLSGSQPASVDVQAVVRILGSKISALTLENAMLQARVLELEAQLRAGASERRQEWLQGVWPIRPEPMPENLFAAEITEDDLIEAMAAEEIERFADDKDMLKMALQMDADQKEIDAKRIREEFKVSQDKRRSAGIKVVARPVRATIEENTGRIVENAI